MISFMSSPLLYQSQKSLITQSIFHLGYLQSYDITFPTYIKIHKMLLLVKTYMVCIFTHIHYLLMMTSCSVFQDGGFLCAWADWH